MKILFGKLAGEVKILRRRKTLHRRIQSNFTFDLLIFRIRTFFSNFMGSPEEEKGAIRTDFQKL